MTLPSGEEGLKKMTERKQLLRQIRLFLLYTFSITWLSWLVIIIANRYFDALWYGEFLFWIPMLIGALGPAIGVYMIYRQFNESFKEESFVKFVFNKRIDRRAWVVFGSYIVWRFFYGLDLFWYKRALIYSLYVY